MGLDLARNIRKTTRVLQISSGNEIRCSGRLGRPDGTGSERKTVQDRADFGPIPRSHRAVGRLAFGWFSRLCGGVLSLCGGVILIVARHSFRNLLRGELAVIFRMQNFGKRTRIRGHWLKSSLFSQCVDIGATLRDRKCSLCLLTTVCCFAALAFITGLLARGAG